MEMLSFGRHQTSKLEPKGVPASSCLSFGPPGSSLGHVNRYKDALGVLWRRPGNAQGSPEEVPASFSALSGEAP